MKLRELMTSQVSTCQPDQTCADIAKMMKQQDVGSIPVVQGKKVTGIITDRDIVLKCIAQDKDPKTCKVSECMTTNVVTGTEDMDAHEAADLMAKHQIRRLPVCDNQGNIVGICAMADLATVPIHVNEAGDALSEISEPTYRTH
jgi:CBS domain-containing protein